MKSNLRITPLTDLRKNVVNKIEKIIFSKIIIKMNFRKYFGTKFCFYYSNVSEKRNTFRYYKLYLSIVNQNLIERNNVIYLKGKF